MKRVITLLIIILVIGGLGYLMFYQPAPTQQKIEQPLNVPAAQ